MTQAETKLLEFINDNLKSLKEDMKARLDKIECKLDKVVTNEECQQHRNECEKQTTENRTLSTIKGEVSIKRITAIGAVITGTIAASTAMIVTIVQVFYP